MERLVRTRSGCSSRLELLAVPLLGGTGSGGACAEGRKASEQLVVQRMLPCDVVTLPPTGLG